MTPITLILIAALATTTSSGVLNARTTPSIARPPLLRHALSIRGGGTADSEYDYSDSDFSDDFDDSSLSINDLNADSNDFASSDLLSKLTSSLASTPPLTKLFLVASFSAAALGFLTSDNQFPPYLELNYKKAMGGGELWRFVTGFLNLGPLSVGWFLTAQFVWTYMSTLERMKFDVPFEFWTMIVFGCVSMVVGYGLMGVNPRYLGHNLSTFLVYVWARYHEGMEVNLMELFNLRAELLPWFFLGQTALLEGAVPLLDFLGIVFGHLYYHGVQVGVVRCPGFVRGWYEGGGRGSSWVREKYKEVGREFEV